MAHKANRRFRAAFVWRARVAHLEARASAESSTGRMEGARACFYLSRAPFLLSRLHAPPTKLGLAWEQPSLS